MRVGMDAPQLFLVHWHGARLRPPEHLVYEAISSIQLSFCCLNISAQRGHEGMKTSLIEAFLMVKTNIGRMELITEGESM